MAEIFENTFENGLNSDIDVKRQQAGTYRDAKNIEITGLGKFMTATNMRGNTKVADLLVGSAISNSFYELGSFDVTVANYEASTDPARTPLLEKAIVVFCKLNGVSKIFYVSTSGNDFAGTGSKVYDVTATEYTGDLTFPNFGEMDAAILGESLHSEVYFTDNTNNVRHLTCIIRDTNGRAGASGTANTPFYWNRNEVAISLFRRFPQDPISISAVALGGGLVCGGYQVSYRYWDQQRNKYSTPAPFTNTVPIYPQEYTEIANKENIFGGTLDGATSKKITVQIAHTSANAANYTHIQLIVAKHIDGTTTMPQKLSVTDPIVLTSTSTSQNYDYTGLTSESEVTTESIVVDNADINTAKTLTVNNNILFLGNLSYFNRISTDTDPTRLHITEKLKSIGNNGIFNPSVANVAKGTIVNDNCLTIQGNDQATVYETRIATNSVQLVFGTLDSCSTAGSNIVTPRYCNNTLGSGAQTFEFSGFVAGNIITITLDYLFDGLAQKDSGSSEYVYSTEHFDYRNYAPAITYIVQDGDTSSTIVDAIVREYNNNRTTQDLDLDNFGGLLRVFYYENINTSHATPCVLRTYFSYLILNFSSDFGVTSGIDTSKTGAGGYKNPLNTTNARGYFRDEVYRFAKVYVDKFGNWGYPSFLDDWKFSGRDTQPIFDTNDSIQALGLNVVIDAGAGNHPDWAVGMLITRAKRIKNILYQSPHIPIMGAMPNIKKYTAGVVNDDEPSDGTWLPKKLSNGSTRNLSRLSSYASTENQLYGFGLQNNILDYNASLNGSVICPPEYIFNKAGTSFLPNVNISGFDLRIVDACGLWMTPQFITRTSNGVVGYPSGLDFGNINVSSNGLAFRADGRANYYWNPSYLPAPKTALSSLFASSNYMPRTGKTKIVNQYYAVRGSTYVTLFEYLAGTNTKLSKIVKYNNMDTVSVANRGQNAIGQRSMLLTLKDVFGDAMFVTGNPDNVTTPIVVGQPLNPSWMENLLTFGNAPDDKWFPYYWSVPTGAPSGTGYDEYRKTRFNDRTWDGILMTPYVVDDATTPTEYYGLHAVLPIVNVELGLPDNRYGTEDAAHEFISTGAYVPITSTTQAINIDVFGGDCFVSKYYYKVNDTHLGAFIDEAIPSPQDYADGTTQDNHIQAVTDCAEVIGVYIESEVNTELSSDRLTYPVPVNNSLSNYNTFFTYEYIFGYSAQNYLKSWFTTSQVGALNSKLEARIAISDKKIYQGNLEGFDTFRAASYYDMEETYGAITKLIRDSNNHAICLQEKGVSDLQVGLKLLTDGAGTETVTYSTTVIDRPQFIISTAGCQHLKTVKQSDDSFYFADARLGKVFKIGGGSGGQISDNGVYSVFLTDLMANFANSNGTNMNADLVAVYDFVNSVYILANNRQSSNGQPEAYVFSDKAGFKWVSRIFLDINPANVATPNKNARFFNMVFSNQNTYMIGRSLSYNSGGDKTDIRVERMFDSSAPPLRMLGQNNSSSVQFVINPLNGYENVYNVFGIDSNARCESVTFTTTKDNNTDTQSITETLSSVAPRQTLYELTIVRDSNGRKLRSPYVLATILINSAAWNETTVNNLVSINKLFTKFVQSPRQI